MGAIAKFKTGFLVLREFDECKLLGVEVTQQVQAF